MKILLAEYDSRWPDLFQREANRISAALGARALQIEHTGSTAVPGLAAKPVIDMLLVVRDSADEQAYAPELQDAGYTLRFREVNWHEHRLFNGPDTEVNLHVFSHGCPEIDRILRFRDWLRSHPEDRDRYAQAKRALAGGDWGEVQEYADAKTGIVEDILARALAGRE